MRFLWALCVMALAPGALAELQEVFAWKQVDFNFSNNSVREEALKSGTYDPKQALPLGIAYYEGRVFISLPKWKAGTPATLTTVPFDAAKNTASSSPLLNPYPNWSWHQRPEGDCDGLTSVFRMEVDQCGRLWVLDSGLEKVALGGKQVCPPQLLIFDLKSDTLLRRYRFPKTSLKDNSFLTGLTLDVSGDQCNSEQDDAFAYIADVWAFGMIAYSFKDDRSYRVEHPYFLPDPLACEFNAGGIDFKWIDGLFGMALTPLDKNNPLNRTLYFHPMSSFHEFSVPTHILRNETAAGEPGDAFKVLAERRGRKLSQASASAMSKEGILLYNLVSRNAIGCWNTHQPHYEGLCGTLYQDDEKLSLPNDLTIDDNNVWVLSDRLHKYLYKELSPEEVNFRVLRGDIIKDVKGTSCDPEYIPKPEELQPKCVP
ncbi:protein yellow-like [Neocloeon triangulifer]|uniref:protein yellow-like n=1 Tax=Neocloeon triangulifer TaxID=2078957 RepID=UPI00286F0E98|nr:protein yellow-like [Neocloeon triangulifer]